MEGTFKSAFETTSTKHKRKKHAISWNRLFRCCRQTKATPNIKVDQPPDVESTCDQERKSAPTGIETGNFDKVATTTNEATVTHFITKERDTKAAFGSEKPSKTCYTSKMTEKLHTAIPEEERQDESNELHPTYKQMQERFEHPSLPTEKEETHTAFNYDAESPTVPEEPSERYIAVTSDTTEKLQNEQFQKNFVKLETMSAHSQHGMYEYPTKKEIEAFYKHQQDLFYRYEDEGRLFQSIKYLNELETTLTNSLARYTDEVDSSKQKAEAVDTIKYHLNCIETSELMQNAKKSAQIAQKVLALFHLDYMKPLVDDNQISQPYEKIRAIPLLSMTSEEVVLFNETGKMYSMHSRSFLPSSTLETMQDALVDSNRPVRKHRFQFRRHFSKGMFRKTSKKQRYLHLAKQNELEGWSREKGKFIDLAYKCEKNASVSVRVRGKIPCEFFKVLAIIRETDLASHWAPFLKESTIDFQYNKMNQVFTQVYEYPLMGLKESVSYAFAVNALEEFGCVIVISVNASENDLKHVKSQASGTTSKKKIPRVSSAELCFLLYPRKSGSRTMLEMYANMVHGQSFIPHRMIGYVVKLIAKGIFTSIMKACEAFDDGIYGERIRKENEFYNWVNDRLESFYMKETADNVKLIEVGSLASLDGANNLD